MADNFYTMCDITQNSILEARIAELIEKHRNCSSAVIAGEVLQLMQTKENKGEEKSEWFFRWIARGKANYAGMTMEQCADMIWYHPLNPYYKVNPWAEKVNAKQKLETGEFVQNEIDKN